MNLAVKEDVGENDQFEAAANHLLQIIYITTQNPGLIKPDDLEKWLTVAAQERERHGDSLAGQFLMRWAGDAARVAKEKRPHAV